MLTLTSQYALQALIYMVRNANGQPIAGPRIARHTNIPAKYLSVILHELVRAGILDSARGKGGGFRLIQVPKQVSLLEAVLPFEPKFSAQPQCAFGNDECSDANPCLAHDQWKKLKDSEQRFLRRTSLYDVAVPRGETSKSKRKKKRRTKS